MTKSIKQRGKGMLNKAIANQLITEEKLNEFIDKNCKLLTSDQLAKLLHVTEGAIRK